MVEQQRLRLLERYIHSWVSVDRSEFLDTLAHNVHLVECYGPEYRTRGECARWFDDWNAKGRVLRWEIHDHWYDPARGTLFASWEFHVDHPDEAEPCFDGITLLRAEDGKITELREYAMKHERRRPYRED